MSLDAAYGSYGGIRSKHPTLAARAALEAARRASSARPPPETSEEEEEEEPSLNFAQKLLLGACPKKAFVSQSADIQPTRRTHLTSTTFGCPLLSLRRPQYSMRTRMRFWKARMRRTTMSPRKPHRLAQTHWRLRSLQTLAARVEVPNSA